MRFMVIVKANEDTEKGVLPTQQELAEMGAYNEELAKAGVLLAGEGQHPSSQGARVRFDKDGGSTVIDGPFAETKELVAGYAIWEVAAMDEAVEWVKRSPVRGSVVELRKILDAEDFDDSFPAELAAAEERAREESATKQ